MKIKVLRAVLLFLMLTVPACSAIPHKPTVEVCVLYPKEGVAYCGEGEPLPPVKKSLDDLDRAVLFPLDSWVKHEAYIEELELYVGK